MTISCKITKEEFLDFVKNEPKTMRQVMEHFKVAQSITIYKFLKRHNLPLSILSRQIKITKEEFLDFVKNEPKTRKELVKHFKVTEKTIDNLLKRHNLPKNILCKQKRTCKITKEEFLDFVKNEPKTMRQVMEHFKVAQSITIYKFLKRHNLPLSILSRQIKITKEEFLDFVKNEPKTMRQVMEHFKVTEPTIYRFFKRHNLPLSKRILSRQKKTILTIKN
jgi:predicted DNA-binding transcriptional regulator AlpA